ncbi:MAG: sensor domain-containing diguanylate cyclase [Candidatus Omnitrophica bacterium]|nr:sensor domain-containing diguanylate cyclase [Candidatus Omnitrophota bacterium]
MKQLYASIFQIRTKRLSLALAFLSTVFLSYGCLTTLNRFSTASHEPALWVGVILFSFCIPTVLGWFSSRLFFGAFFSMTTAVFSTLAAWATQSSSYLLFILVQAALCYLLFRLDERKAAEIIIRNVEIEKAINRKNDMEIAFREEGTSISVLFEKYTSYYNLRSLADDFSASLDLKDLSRIIVSKTMQLIPQGQRCALFLAEPRDGQLSLVASTNLEGEEKMKAKGGDLFDFWVLKNKKSLIVTDIQKDFRFDLQKTAATEPARSVIAAPLAYGGKVIGTLRLSAAEPRIFSTDELRLLDAISTLASAAISNALLYQKTEELAIHDSLTGLYVRRYFLERLIEEHRRSLITSAPLTLLMCDLDHFKACNDRFGHGVGDYVLMKTSDLLKDKASHGIVARYGGEEFAVLLPKISIQEGRFLAQAIRKSLEETKLAVRREMIPMTISIGVASVPVDTLDSEELIRIADRRLYEAKAKGRNRICGGESAL